MLLHRKTESNQIRFGFNGSTFWIDLKFSLTPLEMIWFVIFLKVRSIRTVITPTPVTSQFTKQKGRERDRETAHANQKDRTRTISSLDIQKTSPPISPKNL